MPEGSKGLEPAYVEFVFRVHSDGARGPGREHARPERLEQRLPQGRALRGAAGANLTRLFRAGGPCRVSLAARSRMIRLHGLRERIARQRG